MHLPSDQVREAEAKKDFEGAFNLAQQDAIALSHTRTRSLSLSHTKKRSLSRAHSLSPSHTHTCEQVREAEAKKDFEGAFNVAQVAPQP